MSADLNLNAGDTDITEYVWDYRNRLTNIKHYADYNAYNTTHVTDSAFAFNYDYAGRKLREGADLDGSGGASTMKYDYLAYRGAEPVSMWYDPDGLGGGTAKVLSNRYLLNASGTAVLADEVLVDPKYGWNIGTVWLLADHEGTPRDLAWYDGANDRWVVTHREYAAYGQLLVSDHQTDPGIETIVGFQGALLATTDVKLLAVYTQLVVNQYWMGHRIYNPATGRFMSQDPTTGSGPNDYWAFNDNPFMFVDPSGYCSQSYVGNFFSSLGSAIGSGISQANSWLAAGTSWAASGLANWARSYQPVGLSQDGYYYCASPADDPSLDMMKRAGQSNFDNSTVVSGASLPPQAGQAARAVEKVRDPAWEASTALVQKGYIDPAKGLGMAAEEKAQGVANFAMNFSDNPLGTSWGVVSNTFNSIVSADLWIPQKTKQNAKIMVGNDNVAKGQLVGGIYIAAVLNEMFGAEYFKNGGGAKQVARQGEATVAPVTKLLNAKDVTPGMELAPTQASIFRGGNSLAVRPIDIKVKGGLVQPAHGVSLQVDPTGLDKFGGAYRVSSIPDELKIIQRGKNLNHFEIVPRQPMHIDQYKELLNKVKIEPHGKQ